MTRINFTHNFFPIYLLNQNFEYNFHKIFAYNFDA